MGAQYRLTEVINGQSLIVPETNNKKKLASNVRKCKYIKFYHKISDKIYKYWK